MTKEQIVKKIKEMRDSGVNEKKIISFIKKNSEYNPKEFVYLLI